MLEYCRTELRSIIFHPDVIDLTAWSCRSALIDDNVAIVRKYLLEKSMVLRFTSVIEMLIVVM